MYINQIFELSVMLDNEKFQKVLNRAYNKVEYLDENEDEYIDRSLVSKGITVISWILGNMTRKSKECRKIKSSQILARHDL